MKLSIITVNLNNRDGLQKTIDSVICQSFRDFEWIVIDGGSIDGSKELIEQYADHFAYWVSEPDKGIYNAMNKGIKVAKGEYLQFLNSGDWLYNEHSLLSIFEKDPTEDFVYGENCGLSGRVEGIGSPAKLDFEFLYRNTICHQDIFHKRNLFSNELYDERYKIVADWKFLFESIVHKGASYRKIETIVCGIQEGSSYDDSGIDMERVAAINEIYSPMEISVINDHFNSKSGHSQSELYVKYIEKHPLLKKTLNHIARQFSYK